MIEDKLCHLLLMLLNILYMKLMRIDDKSNDEDAAALKAHIRRLASIFQECNLFPFTF